ncbi:MAG: hypothetical protein WA188_22260 [Terriglobales bacterium]
MKRGLALALLALATSVVVSAQARGGHASAGASRGGGFHAPSSFGQRGFAGSPSSFGQRGFAGGFSGGGIAFGHHPGFVNGSRGRGFRRGYYPWNGSYWPYYYGPYYGWDYPYDDNDTYDANAYQQSQPVTEPPPDDYYYGNRSFNEARSSPRQAQGPPAPAEEQEPTVLVFRDGHKQEVKNYAIVGQMLWDFSAKGTRKIPLADLDLDTTRKLNDERGVEFVLPKA